MTDLSNEGLPPLPQPWRKVYERPHGKQELLYYTADQMREYARAATKAAAPADAQKDHEIREAINQLRDVAVQFHAAQQLRERIAGIVLPLVKGRAPAEDARMVVGEAPEIEAKIAETRMDAGFDGGGHAREEVQDERALFESWAVNHLGQGYPLTMDEDIYEHPVTRWAFKAWKAGRASSVPAIPGTGREKAALERPIDEEIREQLEKGRWCGDSGEPMNKWARAYDARFWLDAAPSHPSEAKAGEDA